jgi:hypothetical protein
VFCQRISSFIHEKATVTLDLDEAGGPRPTSKLSQARTKDIEVLYILRVRPEIKSAPPEEDHQHREAVRKNQERLVQRYQVEKPI